MTMSTQPPKYPAITPRHTPMRMEISADTRPTLSDTRPP